MSADPPVSSYAFLAGSKIQGSAPTSTNHNLFVKVSQLGRVLGPLGSSVKFLDSDTWRVGFPKEPR